MHIVTSGWSVQVVPFSVGVSLRTYVVAKLPAAQPTYPRMTAMVRKTSFDAARHCNVNTRTVRVLSLVLDLLANVFFT